MDRAADAGAEQRAVEAIGALGISGDTGDNDERCALAGIEAAGLVAEVGT